MLLAQQHACSTGPMHKNRANVDAINDVQACLWRRCWACRRRSSCRACRWWHGNRNEHEHDILNYLQACRWRRCWASCRRSGWRGCRWWAPPQCRPSRRRPSAAPPLPPPPTPLSPQVRSAIIVAFDLALIVQSYLLKVVPADGQSYSTVQDWKPWCSRVRRAAVVASNPGEIEMLLAAGIMDVYTIGKNYSNP